MKRPHLSLWGAVTLTTLLLTQAAQCVIVAGANGGSGTNNNTNGSQLNSALGTSFPNFGNVIQYSDSSGVYLGYDPGTNDVWVLSAKHVTATSNGSVLQIAGDNYIQQSRIEVASADLVLIRYNSGSSTVPDLAAVKLATVAPTIGTPIVMIGWGIDRLEGPATDPGISDASGGDFYTWRADLQSNQLLRWGTNNVENSVSPFTVGAINTQGWFADFDMPGAGQWLTSNEASAAARDSGSGAFYLSGGQWVLGGIASGVTTAGISPFTEAGDQEGTFYTDVSTFNLGSIIGTTLVPEPASAALAGLAYLAFAARRRR